MPPSLHPSYIYLWTAFNRLEDFWNVLQCPYDAYEIITFGPREPERISEN